MKSDKSKLLHEVAGVPLCCWPISRVIDFASGIVAVVGHQADEVRQAINQRFDSKVSFVLQSERRGTGDAVKQGLSAVADNAETIMVVYGDTPMLTEQSLRSLSNLRGSAKVAFCTAVLDNPTGYGRVARDSHGEVTAIVEDSDTTDAQRSIREINTGVYAFDAKFLRAQIMALGTANKQNEIYLTDLIEKARELHGAGAVATLKISPEEMLGINDRAQLAQAEALMRQRLNHRWMVQGVTMIDPATTYIDANVELSSDVTLHPGVILKGRTKIAKGAQIFAHSVLEDAVVGQGAKVGPFARLRPGTVLGENTHVGNFVELKKTMLNKGSKANHLAYIGDSEIGENCNIGAGTITCNYDGFKKHVTKIGNGTFVGSNATLVAPLNIGERAYIAAGSTLTEDVAADDLAIGRGRQVNKTGYAKQIRERLK
jgi:bifunctional UDP-N-acetylglucosamine pyrophosphorylase/glucosamine-1-phosphate N-acetyltransferase